MYKYETVIIGAGAAGLMCAATAGVTGKKILVIDSANKPGKKILMSGGGRCNFINLNTTPSNFISSNPHFCKSALSRYSSFDFLKLVEKHRIPYHEKKLGQLFCDNKAKDILNMLLAECDKENIKITLNRTIKKIEKINDNNYQIKTSDGIISCNNIVVATGGLSIPTLGASSFGYEIAKQFDIKVLPTYAALVPFILKGDWYQDLAGVSFLAIVSNKKVAFKENVLFTHKGLSGPAILQISSYWSPEDSITINALPDNDLSTVLLKEKKDKNKKQIKSFLCQFLPKRLISKLLADDLLECNIVNLSNEKIKLIADSIHNWQIHPIKTEGYRTAEVTKGGVDCNEISSKTFESKKHKGLYFIGEVLDVTGHLGGFNFHWAWASAVACGQSLVS